MRPILFTAVVGVMIAGTAQAATDAGTSEPPPPDVSKLRFTPEAIRLVMGYYQPKIQGCYEEFLATRKKPIDGKLMTAFVVTAEGLVSKPKVLPKGTTLRDRKLHDCVKTVLGSVEFPKPNDGEEHPIEFPFNLKSIK